MPELPEVETIRKQVVEYLPLDIKSVSYTDVHKSILKQKDFSPKDKRIEAIERKGKMLNFILNDDYRILSNLGMSGSWRISKEKIDAKHAHIKLNCINTSGEKVFLAYVDPRRFGNMYFMREADAQKKLSTLGPDIGTDECSPDYLFKLFKKYPNKQLKPMLLEQNLVSGVGNYIACEICARSGILPTRSAGNISKEDSKKIKKAALSVLEGSLKYKGLSFHGGYYDATGKKGDALQNLVVFHQKVCGLCQETGVIKSEIKGRGTYHCPKCQK